MRFSLGGAAMAAALCLSVPSSFSPAFAKPIKVGEQAPDFELTLIDGTKIKRDDLRGQVVVLNFWATWCAPCREELPLLDAYYALQKKAGLRVFAITTEDSVPLNKLKTLFAALNMPSVRRIKGPCSEIKAVPTNYVIDRAGRIRYAKAALMTLDTLNEVLVPLLREPAPVESSSAAQP